MEFWTGEKGVKGVGKNKGRFSYVICVPQSDNLIH